MDYRGRRRSLSYIRLAAWFAAQPGDVDRVTLTLDEIEEVIGAPLPPVARFPSWWRNDVTKTHSRAWLTAGWTVEEMTSRSVVFTRNRSVAPVE